MVRFLLIALALLLLASVASAGHRAGLFGTRERARLVVKDRHVERERGVALTRLRGIVGGGCVGTVRGAGCAGTVGAGCGGYAGPSLPVPPVAPVPAPMPPVKMSQEPQLETFSYWTITRDGLVKRQGVRTVLKK